MSSSSMRVNRFIFYASTMLFWFSIYTYVPILTPYVEALGGSVLFAGYVVGSYGFTQLLVRIPIGIWSDRLNSRKSFILGGIACGLISSLGFAVTDNVWLTLLWRAFAGLAAGSWVAFTVLYAGYFSPDEAPKAMGVISFYTSVAQMIASALGGLVADIWDWHAAFYLGAAGGLAGLATAAWITEQDSRSKGPAPEFRSLIRMGGQWPLLSVSLLAVLAQIVTFSTMFGFTPLYAIHIGANKAELGALTVVSTLPNAVAGYISGTVLARRFGERMTAAGGFVIAALGTAAIPLSHTVGLLFLTQAMNGFGQGLTMPILMGLSIARVSPEKRATAMGFFQAIYSLGMVAGPVFVGWMGSHIGLPGGFASVAAISALAAILTLLWLRQPAPAR